jgi:acyl dehydratase
MLSMGFVAQSLTDWLGVGSVRRIGVRFTALVRLKDVVTCRGRVVGTRAQNGEHRVDLEVWAENQRGETVVRGTAEVALPSRPAP